ncbi:hypothetical protein FOA52_012271 [Chlamydomonas sp. UWO 241]|nr:hypothetical protein FOA52_012271 [Chlamydomonas sp. UWO 241]
MAPRVEVPVREILYQLSPYQHNVIGQAFANAPSTFMHFMMTKGRGYATTFACYSYGVWWTKNEIHKEKMHERF